MKIKLQMTQNASGSECGKFTKHYVQGEIYEIEDSLGNVFVSLNVAKKVVDVVHKAVTTFEFADEPVIQNKALDTNSYLNKSKRKGK